MKALRPSSIRTWALTVLHVLACAGVCAQAFDGENNLLEDGSFEVRKWCPSSYNLGNLKTLKHWSQPTQGTPDHFDGCAGSGREAGVPKNIFGQASPVDGEGYAGLVLYSASKPNYREYLTTKLSRTLSPGEWVCLGMWVISADGGRLVSDQIGAALTPQAPRQKDEAPLRDVTPAMQNPSLHMLSDRHSWIRLSDAYQAVGGERWLTLGSFSDRTETRVLERSEARPESSMWSYVYIDGVEVKPVLHPDECECLNRSYEEEATDPPWQVFLKDRIQLSSVLFAFDSFELDKQAMSLLDEVAETMRKNRFVVMEVNGHTDITGPDGYNLTLSERRAQEVMNHLIRQGVDPHRLRLSYHGSRLPAADNATPDGRRQNRRVEFELLEHAFLPID